jgi:hypothetical protein
LRITAFDHGQNVAIAIAEYLIESALIPGTWESTGFTSVSQVASRRSAASLSGLASFKRIVGQHFNVSLQLATSDRVQRIQKVCSFGTRCSGGNQEANDEECYKSWYVRHEESSPKRTSWF